jgi:hypothetical protein
MRYALYISLSLLIIVSFILWQYTDQYDDFGLNLFTELVGIGVTVFIIEKIIEKNKEVEKKPLTAAVYYDTRLLVNRYMLFFQELYRNSVDEEEPVSLRDFLSAKTFNKIMENIDMDSKPLVYPETNMWIHITNNANDFYKLGSNILDKHGSHLDPRAFNHIHGLTESNFITSWRTHLLVIYNFDKVKNIPRPKILSAYSIEITQEELDAVFNLYTWCSKVYDELSVDYKLPSLAIYSTMSVSERKFHYKKDQSILEQEILIWNKYQGRESSHV